MGTKVYDNALDLITFTRASGGTALRKVSYGPELVSNGTFDTASNWTVAGSWAISGGQATNSGSVTNEDLRYDLTVGDSSKVYLVSYEIVSNTGGSSTFFIRFGSSFVTNLFADPLTPGVKTAVISGATVASGAVVFRAVSGQTVTIDNVSVKEVLFDQPFGTLTLFNHPNNVPRIDYNADGTVKGLLIEEQRTNLVQYSEAFDNAAWTKAAGVSITPNTDVAPDGSTTADTLTSTANQLDQTVSCATSTVYTNSIYIKKTTGATYTPGLYTLFSGGTLVIYAALLNTDTGEVTAVSAGGFTAPSAISSTDAGDYWRVSVSGNSNNNTSVSFRLYANLNAGAAAGAGTQVIWGAQTEAGSFPTSYIPNAGAPSGATRSADIASIPVTDFGYNQKAGTVVVEWNQPVNAASYLAMLYDGTALNRAFLRQFADGKVYWSTITDNVSQGDVLSGTAVDGSYDKVAAALRLNDAAAALNGAAAVVDATYLVPEGITSLAIGSYVVPGTQYVNGHIKSIQYYPRRLSNAQLQELTS